MSTKITTKQDLQKRFKIDDKIFSDLIKEGVISDKDTFTDGDIEKLKNHRKENPFTKEELQKRFKITNETFSVLIEKGLIKKRPFYSEKESEFFKSFIKLRKLGYGDDACIQVLEQVGIPEDENLFKNSDYVQLKELAAAADIPERTIKFYEKSSIIPKPKIYKNKRFYRKSVIKELELIRDLQKLGYKLSSIASLLETLRKKDNPDTKPIKDLIMELEEKKHITDRIIAALKEYT